jgi:selenocysteine-specific elongation factor
MPPPLPCRPAQDSAIIGARLDLDSHGDSCRLAFYGRLLSTLDPGDPRQLARLKVYKVRAGWGWGKRAALRHAPPQTLAPAPIPTPPCPITPLPHRLGSPHPTSPPQPKERAGTIERVAPDGSHAICRGMFKKETDLSPFLGATVTTGAGEAGTIEGRFGASGKFRVAFLPPPAAPEGGGSGRPAAAAGGGGTLTLRYKKFVFEDRRGGRARIQQ